MKKIRADIKFFNLHSPQTGCATASAAAGVNDTFDKKHEDGNQRKLKMGTFMKLMKQK